MEQNYLEIAKANKVALYYEAAGWWSSILRTPSKIPLASVKITRAWRSPTELLTSDDQDGRRKASLR